MVKVVSVKFKEGGKSYYFAPGKDSYEKGQGVIVETTKGLEYATVSEPAAEVEDGQIVSPLKPIIRIATARDKEQVERNLARRDDAIKIAEEKIAARGLEMKLVDCEFAFDGSKVTFYFTAENRVDFRELIKDLSSAFRMRIELRQINVRDEIKILGGFGPCGRECCCIRSFPEAKKVSVKMAKNQGLSLNPGKISGMCGKLMCCLAYENEYYAEACKKVPKLGSEAETPDGKGTVVNVNMLKMEVKVKIEERDAVSYHDYPIDQIRFMRGNVVMGKDPGEREDEDDEADALVDAEEAPVGNGEVQPRGDRRENGENRENRRRQNRNRNNAEKNRGDKQGARHGNQNGERGEQPRAEGQPRPEGEKGQGGNRGGNFKKRHKKRNFAGKERQPEGNPQN